MSALKTEEMGGTFQMDLKEIFCADRRWMELAEDHVQWRSLLVMVWDVLFLVAQWKICIVVIADMANSSKDAIPVLSESI
jgi:hypothetical protein